MKHVLIYIVLLVIVIAGRCNWVVAESTADTLEYQLEIQYHETLFASKNQPASILNEFTTDGCSGGLSVGWQYLAGKIETFREVHGTHPPWESCCVSHDKEYHAGGGPDISAELSYELRRRADRILEMCVRDAGGSRAAELSAVYGISVEEVRKLYAVVSRLMYRAVRIGGLPCTGLPWRWGYGWPECE